MIEINNLTTILVDEESLKNIAQLVLKKEKKEKSGLSIAFIGQARMRKLNERYRRKNRVTDVLAFPAASVFFENFKTGDLQKIEGLGEIVICLREVKKNAKKFGQSFQKELALCLIHGILHLLGYDHERSKVKAKEMAKKEQYYLKLWQELT